VNRLALSSLVLILGSVAVVAQGCAGASEQDVLSNQVGNATASSTSSSGASSGTSGSSGASSGTTSGGTTSSSSGNTAGCTQEGDDSGEANPVAFTTKVCGALKFPRDQEDWAQYDLPKNSKVFINFTGPVLLTIWNEKGEQFDLAHIPNNPGTYSIQIQYDFKKFPLGGDAADKPGVYAWTVTLSTS